MKKRQKLKLIFKIKNGQRFYKNQNDLLLNQNQKNQKDLK